MYIIKVMKRKDAASVLLAVVVGLILSNFLSMITVNWATNLSGLGGGRHGLMNSSLGWQRNYLYPIVYALLQLIFLEIVIYAYTSIHDALRKK